MGGETGVPVLFAAPAQPALTQPRAGEVWLYPPLREGGPLRVIVVDFGGMAQIVTYFGGRVFDHGGAIPGDCRDNVVAACKYVRAEWLKGPGRPAPSVSQWSATDGAFVVQIDTSEGTGHVRVVLNEAALFDTDPEGTLNLSPS
jgi:hypothetical protein